MFEQDQEAGETKKAEVVLGMIFPADNQTAVVIEPGEETFDAPAFAIAAQTPSVLCSGARSAILPVRCNHLGSVLREDFYIEWVAVVGFVVNKCFRRFGQKSFVQGLRDQSYFSRGSTRRANGDRKTMAVRNCHDFSAFPALGFPDAAPPFLAGANVPSIKHSERSKPPRSFKSWATAKSTCSSTPVRTQFWNRRCTVWCGPYRSGKSFHGAPVRRIQSTPLNTVRRSLHGRPRLSRRTGSSGRMVSTTLHCSSVRSIHNYLYINS